MAKKKKRPWPPPGDSIVFIHSEEFGTLLVRIVEDYVQRYPQMDFTDAVAQVFEWFSGRIEIEPDFLKDRFETAGAFRAYLRQAVWNAARLAARRRMRSRWVTELSPEMPIRAQEISAEELAELSEAVEKLKYPHKEILERLFFDEEADVHVLAAAMGMELAEFFDVYDEAIDQLADLCDP